MHDAALTVLAEFSGLIIDEPEVPTENRATRLRRRQLWIDGERAAVESEDPAACEDYSEAVGDILVPVGGELVMTVLIGERGAVWGAFSGDYGFIADSFVPAVARILLRPLEGWWLDHRLPDDPATEELIRQRRLEEERLKQQRDWRRFRRRSR